MLNVKLGEIIQIGFTYILMIKRPVYIISKEFMTGMGLHLSETMV